MVTVKEHSPLWNKIQDFRLDEESAVIKFSDKLSAQQNWSPAFTKRAIEEYRKFIFLCCISEKGASPSHTVDEVWHLHLTYTQSYWVDFCKNTLGRDVHHHPSAGGDGENHKHEEWYKENLAMYGKVFGMTPPLDIWPRPTEKSWFIDTADPSIDKKTVWRIAIILSLPFLFIFASYQKLFPFFLKGPDFLVFYPVFGLALLAAHIARQKQLAKGLAEIVEANFPEDASAFQMAKFLYGKHRAVQAGIVDLLQRNLLEVDRDKYLVIKSAFYTPPPNELNPLVPAFVKETHGGRNTYEELVYKWYGEERFSHPALEALYAFAHREDSFFNRYVFLIVFWAIGLIRICQGLLNDRPVALLLPEIFVCSAIFAVAAKYFARKAMVFKKAETLYRERLESRKDYYDAIVPRFVVNGTDAIRGFSEGVLLAGVFSAYSAMDFYSSSSGGTSCSSCSGSSDSGGGSSCGGSSCGGGGCGGCGGGGD